MKVQVDLEKCTGCGICVEICPVNAVELKKGKAMISDECVVCGQCLAQCPDNAISLISAYSRSEKNAYLRI